MCDKERTRLLPKQGGLQDGDVERELEAAHDKTVFPTTPSSPKLGTKGIPRPQRQSIRRHTRPPILEDGLLTPQRRDHSDSQLEKICEGSPPVRHDPKLLHFANVRLSLSQLPSQRDPLRHAVPPLPNSRLKSASLPPHPILYRFSIRTEKTIQPRSLSSVQRELVLDTQTLIHITSEREAMTVSLGTF